MESKPRFAIPGELIELGPIPTVPDFLTIARLYLEKYETLADEDRWLYRHLIAQLANLPMIVGANIEAPLPQSIRDARAIEAHNASCAKFLARDRKEPA